MKRLFRAIGHTVRYKLLALTLFPILLVMPVALLAALYWGSNFSYQQLFMKVTTDLSVASDVFRRIRRDYLGELARLGESYAFRKALEQGHLEALRTQLHEARRASGFSYLNLVGRQRPYPGRFAYRPARIRPPLLGAGCRARRRAPGGDRDLQPP